MPASTPLATAGGQLLGTLALLLLCWLGGAGAQFANAGGGGAGGGQRFGGAAAVAVPTDLRLAGVAMDVVSTAPLGQGLTNVTLALTDALGSPVDEGQLVAYLGGDTPTQLGMAVSAYAADFSAAGVATRSASAVRAGVFSAALAFPKAGTYVVIADFVVMTTSGTLRPLFVSRYARVDVGGASTAPATPANDITAAAGVAWGEATAAAALDADATGAGVLYSTAVVNDGNEVYDGACVKLTLSFHADAARSVPATDLEPVWGTPVHVFIATADAMERLLGASELAGGPNATNVVGIDHTHGLLQRLEGNAAPSVGGGGGSATATTLATDVCHDDVQHLRLEQMPRAFGPSVDMPVRFRTGREDEVGETFVVVAMVKRAGRLHVFRHAVEVLGYGAQVSPTTGVQALADTSIDVELTKTPSARAGGSAEKVLTSSILGAGTPSAYEPIAVCVGEDLASVYVGTLRRKDATRVTTTLRFRAAGRYACAFDLYISPPLSAGPTSGGFAAALRLERFITVVPSAGSQTMRFDPNAAKAIDATAASKTARLTTTSVSKSVSWKVGTYPMSGDDTAGYHFFGNATHAAAAATNYITYDDWVPLGPSAAPSANLTVHSSVNRGAPFYKDRCLSWKMTTAFDFAPGSPSLAPFKSSSWYTLAIPISTFATRALGGERPVITRSRGEVLDIRARAQDRGIWEGTIAHDFCHPHHEHIVYDTRGTTTDVRPNFLSHMRLSSSEEHVLIGLFATRGGVRPSSGGATMPAESYTIVRDFVNVCMVPDERGTMPWSDPCTWGNGRGGIPEFDQVAWIPEKRRVVYDATQPAMDTINVIGTLEVNPPAGGNITLATETIFVHAGAEFSVGSEDAPLPASSRVDLKLLGAEEGGCESDATDGIALMGVAGGAVRMYGSVSGRTRARLAQPCQVGATELILAEGASFLGTFPWVVDAKLSLAPGDDSFWHTEDATIAAISGDRVTLKAPLAYAHDREVVVLSRNIRLHSTVGAGGGGRVLFTGQYEAPTATLAAGATRRACKRRLRRLMTEDCPTSKATPQGDLTATPTSMGGVFRPLEGAPEELFAVNSSTAARAPTPRRELHAGNLGYWLETESAVEYTAAGIPHLFLAPQSRRAASPAPELTLSGVEVYSLGSRGARGRDAIVAGSPDAVGVARAPTWAGQGLLEGQGKLVLSKLAIHDVNAKCVNVGGDVGSVTIEDTSCVRSQGHAFAFYPPGVNASEVASVHLGAPSKLPAWTIARNTALGARAVGAATAEEGSDVHPAGFYNSVGPSRYGGASVAYAVHSPTLIYEGNVASGIEGFGYLWDRRLRREGIFTSNLQHANARSGTSRASGQGTSLADPFSGASADGHYLSCKLAEETGRATATVLAPFVPTPAGPGKYPDSVHIDMGYSKDRIELGSRESHWYTLTVPQNAAYVAVNFSTYDKDYYVTLNVFGNLPCVPLTSRKHCPLYREGYKPYDYQTWSAAGKISGADFHNGVNKPQTWSNFVFQYGTWSLGVISNSFADTTTYGINGVTMSLCPKSTQGGVPINGTGAFTCVDVQHVNVGVRYEKIALKPVFTGGVNGTYFSFDLPERVTALWIGLKKTKASGIGATQLHLRAARGVLPFVQNIDGAYIEAIPTLAVDFGSSSSNPYSDVVPEERWTVPEPNPVPGRYYVLVYETTGETPQLGTYYTPTEVEMYIHADACSPMMAGDGYFLRPSDESEETTATKVRPPCFHCSSPAPSINPRLGNGILYNRWTQAPGTGRRVTLSQRSFARIHVPLYARWVNISVSMRLDDSENSQLYDTEEDREALARQVERMRVNQGMRPYQLMLRKYNVPFILDNGEFYEWRYNLIERKIGTGDPFVATITVPYYMTHASAGEWYAAVEWASASGAVWWKMSVSIEQGSCPSNPEHACSGHGTCYYSNVTSTSAREDRRYKPTGGLASEQVPLCACDPGFSGEDCSHSVSEEESGYRAPPPPALVLDSLMTDERVGDKISVLSNVDDLTCDSVLPIVLAPGEKAAVSFTYVFPKRQFTTEEAQLRDEIRTATAATANVPAEEVSVVVSAGNDGSTAAAVEVRLPDSSSSAALIDRLNAVPAPDLLKDSAYLSQMIEVWGVGVSGIAVSVEPASPPPPPSPPPPSPSPPPPTTTLIAVEETTAASGDGGKKTLAGSTLVAVIASAAGGAVLLGLVGGYVAARRRAYTDVLKMNPYGQHTNSAYAVEVTNGHHFENGGAAL